jgi:hypothetical protein
VHLADVDTSCPWVVAYRYEEESETVDDSLMPDGLDEDMWARFQAYRGSRVGGGGSRGGQTREEGATSSW